MILKCYKCGLNKTPPDFHKGPNRTGPRSQYASYCKECISAYSKQYEYKYRETRVAYRQRVKHTPEVKLKQLLKTNTVDRSQLDFEWCWDRLDTLHFKCEVTGKAFTWGSKEPTSLSIDRIDPTKGYTKDNVRFVCWWINAAMGTWGEDTIRELIKEWMDNE